MFMGVCLVAARRARWQEDVASGALGALPGVVPPPAKPVLVAVLPPKWDQTLRHHFPCPCTPSPPGPGCECEATSKRHRRARVYLLDWQPAQGVGYKRSGRLTIARALDYIYWHSQR